MGILPSFLPDSDQLIQKSPYFELINQPIDKKLVLKY